MLKCQSFVIEMEDSTDMLFLDEDMDKSWQL